MKCFKCSQTHRWLFSCFCSISAPTSSCSLFSEWTFWSLLPLSKSNHLSQCPSHHHLMQQFPTHWPAASVKIEKKKKGHSTLAGGEALPQESVKLWPVRFLNQIKSMLPWLQDSVYCWKELSAQFVVDEISWLRARNTSSPSGGSIRKGVKLISFVGWFSCSCGSEFRMCWSLSFRDEVWLFNAGQINNEVQYSLMEISRTHATVDIFLTGM